MATLATHLATHTGARPGIRAQLQAASGLVVLLFVIAHVSNTILLALSFTAYDRVQVGLRAVYQQPVAEALLVLALLVHMSCGALAIWQRRGEPALRRGSVSPRQRWQRRAGWFLLASVLGHMVATRAPSLLADVYPGAGGVSFTVTFLPLIFYPYYFLFGLAAIYHGASGLQTAAARFGVRMPIERWLPALTVLGAVGLILALLGAGGALYAIPDPYANRFAHLVLGIVGRFTGNVMP